MPIYNMLGILCIIHALCIYSRVFLSVESFYCSYWFKLFEKRPFYCVFLIEWFIDLNWKKILWNSQNHFHLWFKMRKEDDNGYYYDGDDEKSYNRKRWALLIISLIVFVACIAIFSICIWIRFDLDFWEWCVEIEW